MIGRSHSLCIDLFGAQVYSTGLWLGSRASRSKKSQMAIGSALGTRIILR